LWELRRGWIRVWDRCMFLLGYPKMLPGAGGPAGAKKREPVAGWG